MKNVRLGRTEIVVPQNAFGCLPIQRDTTEVAVALLRQAYEGGMRFFDTARAYTDSEEKVGEAFDGMREKVYIATKTAAKTPEGFWKDLETSLKNLRTDYIDIYQLHMVGQCYRPGDGTGMYECLVEAKEKGLIRHIGITTHKLAVAQEIIESGLYETLQYPFSYLSSEKEIAERYRSMCFVIGKKITIIKGNEQRHGTAVSLDDRCHLLVRYEDGTDESLFSGEISLRMDQ